MPTPMRSLRLDDETWALLEQEAAHRGISRSELMREAIEELALFRPKADKR